MKVAASPHSFLIPLFSLLPLEGGAPKGAEVGSRSGIFTREVANPASLRLSLPHWGRGTAASGARVLSYIACLRRSPPLFFISLSPSNLRPFGAPPSIGRRECPR